LIAKEGFPFIIAGIVSFFIVLIIPKSLLIFLLFILTVFFFVFFRDPERKPPEFEKVVVSGADGKVVEIIEEEIYGNTYTKVSVFMNVFNVHINRMPISGKFESIEHKKGKFMPADKPESSIENEQRIYKISTDYGTIIVKQVAGLVARRTVSYVNEGDELAIGERFGMIKFSSRVDHYFPKGFNIVVNIDDKVVAGESIIARFEEPVEDVAEEKELSTEPMEGANA
jgi:phosphatidylserine decarboxylase